jgi:MipA family protein
MTASSPTFRTAILAGMAAATFLSSGLVKAQDRERGHTVSIGGGVQAYPRYPGADGSKLRPMPIIDFRRQGSPLPFEAPDEGWGFTLFGEDGGFEVGPAVQFQGKRREEDVGAAVGDVGFTLEAGAFAQFHLSDNFRVRVEGRKGLGGHEGWVGDVSADFVLRDRDTYVFSIGPRLRLSDDRYQDAYFSVTPAVATATGLPAFDAGGGLHAVGVSAGLTYMLDRHWGLYTYAGYDRLINDAADSPIARNFGSRDQFSGGIGLFYSFDIGNLFGG